MTKYAVDPGELTKEAQGNEEPGRQATDICVCGSNEHKPVDGPRGQKMCPEGMKNFY
jgi:CDGSH-type Zn-finger protein